MLASVFVRGLKCVRDMMRAWDRVRACYSLVPPVS